VPLLTYSIGFPRLCAGVWLDAAFSVSVHGETGVRDNWQFSHFQKEFFSRSLADLLLNSSSPAYAEIHAFSGFDHKTPLTLRYMELLLPIIAKAQVSGDPHIAHFLPSMEEAVADGCPRIAKLIRDDC